MAMAPVPALAAHAEGIVIYEAGEGAARRGKARVPVSRWVPDGCGKGKSLVDLQRKKSCQSCVRAALAPREVPMYPKLVGRELSWADSGRFRLTVRGSYALPEALVAWHFWMTTHLAGNVVN
jgi:hypothetical protein